MQRVVTLYQSTVGKKVMGLRVLRLDGEPITWWVAFERAGGYAAGFATGRRGGQCNRHHAQVRRRDLLPRLEEDGPGLLEEEARPLLARNTAERLG